MIKYRVFLSVILSAALLAAVLLFLGSRELARRIAGEIPAKRNLVRTLGLTDLALWTEARYTRHPSQADLFTPFQDFPSSLEHFPAGSIVAPRVPTSAPVAEAP